MRVIGVVQTRVNSTRLPKKALLPIGGRAMFLRTWDRLSLTPGLQPVIVATSCDPSNDIVEAICGREGIGCVRGAKTDHDVLTRFMAVLRAYPDAETVIRVTPDCPLVDPALVHAVVRAWDDRPNDYASNVLVRRYPDGLDVEVISADCLRWLHTRVPWDRREEFTRVIWECSAAFAHTTISDEEDWSGLKWTVDYPEDLEFARWAYERLPEGFGWRDVLALKDHRDGVPAEMLWRLDPTVKEPLDGRERSS